MKYSIVTTSISGNTKMLADVIKEAINEKELIYFGAPDKKALDADVIYVGFWTNRGTCDKICAEFLNKINNKKIFLFGTAGFGLSQEYFEQILKNASININETNEIIGKYMCTGKMSHSVKEKYLKQIEEDPENPLPRKMLMNFEMASSHPNDEDLENLRKLL